MSLRELLEVSRDQGGFDPAEFARLVFSSEDRFDALALRTTNSSKVESLVARKAYVNSAASVLAKALELNPDESTVLRWFNCERLQDFGLMTPAEMISHGQTDTVMKYIESLDSGASG